MLAGIDIELNQFPKIWLTHLFQKKQVDEVINKPLNIS